MQLRIARNLVSTRPWVLLMLVALLAAASSARADTILYQLTTANPAVSIYLGPYADVSVNRTSTTTALITFTSLSNGANTFLFANGGSAAVNVNATSWTVGSFGGSNAGIGFTPGALSDAGSGNEDGFGSFNQKIDTFDGYTRSRNILSFIITNTSGTWASAANVLTQNASGNVVAAHIFVADCGTAASCDAGIGALATGFATTGVATIPEPGTAGLLGAGLLGLALNGRRKN